MRLILSLIFSVSFIFSFAQDPVRDPICKDLSNIIEWEMSHNKKLLQFRTNVLTQNYDIIYHRLSLEVDPAVFYIKGSVTSYFKPTSDNFNQINFDFSDVLTINKIIYHGEDLSWIQSDNNLQINLPQAILEGTLDSIFIDYEGVPNEAGFGAFAQANHNGTPIIWTLSEPYGALEWWPCKQDLNDKADSIDVIVLTPEANRVGSNGLLVSEEQLGDMKQYHWKHRYPIAAYLVAIAVTNYEVFTDYVILESGKSLPILNYVFPESFNNAQFQLENSIEIMELFNQLFGDYPFEDEKYGHAQFGWGGGMEHQTMSFMANFSYGLQAHEMAHQWFGDKITCGSWEDIWLNEGFATYLTGLTSEFLGSETDWNNWKINRLASITSEPSGSVWVDDTTSIARIFSGKLSYNKGAYLLHMLRWTLGDEDFFQAIRNYLEDPQLAFAYARTHQLQNHLEAQSGMDLEEFFNDWFYGQGYPSYEVNWSMLEDKIRIELNQTTAHPSVSFFEMPIPIMVSGQGKDTLLRLDHHFSGEVIEIPLGFQVDEVIFDPDLWLISAGNVVNEVPYSGIDPALTAAFLNTSPNPFSDLLEVSFTDNTPVIQRMEIRNAEGIEIYAENNPEQNKRIDATDWPAGSYFISAISDQGNVQIKIQKL